MNSDCIDSLSPIQVTHIDKKKEFRKKDIMSKLDPKYLRYEKLLIDEVRRRKSNTEKNSLELNNYINNKLMKASLLREKFYQKRRLNLKEKHNRINQKRKKSFNGSQKNNILKSKKVLAKMARERKSIDYTCIKESLLSSDSSVFSSDSLSSSASNIDLHASGKNLSSQNIQTPVSSDVTEKKNNNESKTIIEEPLNNNNIDNEFKNINDNNNNNNNNDSNNNNNNNINNDNNSNINNNNNINNQMKVENKNVVTENNEVINITNTSMKKDPSNNSVKQSRSSSRKSSKNTVERSDSVASKSGHHHRHHHHKNNEKGYGNSKKRLNEISTGIYYLFKTMFIYLSYIYIFITFSIIFNILFNKLYIFH